MWFLIGVYFAFILALVPILEWALGIDINFISTGTLYIAISGTLVGALIPRAGFKFARYICGSWYQKSFGETYADYRKNQKLVIAKELLKNNK